MSDLYLRPATSSDMEATLAWANDPDTRAASFQTAVITRQIHAAWFENSLQRPDRHLFIAMLPDTPPLCAGFVRLQYVSDTLAEVSINIAPEARGRGVGRRALRALEQAARERGFEKLLATIRPENLGSVRAFRSVDYEAITDGEVGGERSLRFVRSLTDGQN
ncbi:MAG: GNAT family N-acetyltransferase [Myxococcales bacterium]|nr:GNAT family N-acetyltransferase [Myxococcales bacterium]